MNNNENSNKPNADEEILEIAKQRFQQADDAWSEIRKAALEDLKFSAGDQWPEETRRLREADSRPCLTINRLPQFIRQITNDQRQNRPSIKVSPVDDQGDPKTAKVIQGLTRNIENISNADTVYDIAFDSAVRAGYGFFRVITDYADEMSFDQEIRLKAVHDRFSAHLDPSFQEPDGSDANWGFVEEEIPKDLFKAQYPDAKLCGFENWADLERFTDGWVKNETVRVCEYFYKELEETTIYLLSNGQVVEKSELPEIPGVLLDTEGNPIEVLRERKTLVPRVKWCKLNGYEVLEKTDWPGKWIPIIPVLGEELIIEGKRSLAGLVRNAKDSQRIYNYFKSSETETIALAPRAPWVGGAGAFAGFEPEWATANSRNHAFLEFNQFDDQGRPITPPQRNVYEPPVQAITQATMMAADDLKATTGIYDAALGAKSNENSGIAIQRRNVQSQTSNFHFVDNLSKSIRHAGRIIVDLIPHIYDTQRMVRILGDEGTEEIVWLNKQFEHNGEMVHYRTDIGKYDVSVDTGPSFETKRQEAAAMMADLIGKYPNLMQIAGDLLVKNLDLPDAQVISERIKKTLPPGLAEDKEKQPLPPETQQQLTQMGQMIDQLTATLHQLHEEKDKKLVEIQSKERIEAMRLETQAAIELARLQSKEALSLLQHQVAELDARSKMPIMGEEQEQDFNQGMSPDQPQALNQQQPTGGLPPGTPMGV